MDNLIFGNSDPTKTRPAKPRRYVRVRLLHWRATWTCDFCHSPGECSGWTSGSVPAWTWTARDAAEHSRRCPAVAAAMERDRLAAELAQLRAETSRIRAERAAWRTKAHQLAAELVETRETKTC